MVRGAARVVVVAARVVVVVAAVVVVVGRTGRRALAAALASGTLASSSVTQTQPALLAPTPRALKERLRMRRLAPAERISSRWAASTLAAQRTCSSQAEAGCTAAASPGWPTGAGPPPCGPTGRRQGSTGGGAR